MPNPKCEICNTPHWFRGKRTCGKADCLSALLKREQKAKAEKVAQRDADIRAELNAKENGVRKGTLLLLAICEQTEDSPSFADGWETLQRSIYAETIQEAKDKPMYSPMVD